MGIPAICGMKFSFCLSLFFLVVTSGEAKINPSDIQVSVSPKCAAVILVAGSAVGGTTAYTITPRLLSAAGFTSVGVGAKTFASWWQSTMPLVARGSAFSVLQSVAMGGTDIATLHIGAAIGRSTTAAYLSNTAALLNQVCEFVDDADPPSTLGRAVSACVTLARQTKTNEWLPNFPDDLPDLQDFVGISTPPPSTTHEQEEGKQ